MTTFQGEPATAWQGYEIAIQQKACWWWHQRLPGARCTVAHRISGALDAQALRAGLEAAASRHEIFATVYRSQPGLHFPSQVVTGEPLIDMRVIPAPQGLGLDEVASLVEQAGTDDVRPDAGPMLTALIASSGEEHLVVLSAPLLAADERTLHDLITDAAELAASSAPDCDGPTKPPEPVQYSDYAGWQLDTLSENRAANADTGPGEPPLSIARPAGLTDRSGFRFVSADVGREPARRVSDAASLLGISEEQYLFGCWALLLSMLGAGSHFSLGAFYGGRSDEDLASAAGPFEICIPVAADVGDGITVAEAVQRAATNMAEAAAQTEALMPALESWLRPHGPVESRLPSFRYLRLRPSQGLTRPECVPGRVLASARPALLCLDVVRGEHGITVTLSYDRSRFDDTTMSTVARLFPLLMAAAAADPEVTVTDFSFIDDDESERARARAQAWARNLPVPDVAPITLFRHVARRSPDRVAVTAGEQEMTFGELARQVDDLANELRRRGIGPGHSVMIGMERTPWMIVAARGALGRRTSHWT